MEKQGHRKSKNKKAATKPKTTRKRTSEGKPFKNYNVTY